MTKQSFTIIDLLHTGNLYTLNSYANMFTINDSIFPNTWTQFSNPKFNYYKKSQLVTITSADYDAKSLNNKWFSQMGQNNIAK